MAAVVDMPQLDGVSQDGNDSILVCESLADLVEHAKRYDGWKDHTYPGTCSLFTRWALNGKSRDEVLSTALHGDLEIAERAGKLLDKFNDDLGFNTHKWGNVDAVVGGAVNIGAYCAGAPVCMRQRRRVLSVNAPLSVVVDLGASSDCRPREIDNRGVAAMALLQRLANARPISLYVCAAHSSPAGGNIGCIVKMAAPLEIATVGNALASTGFVRHIMFGVENAIREFGCGAKPWDSHRLYRDRGAAFWRRFTGDDTLFIPAIKSGELITRDPCKWVNDMLAKHGGIPVDA